MADPIGGALGRRRPLVIEGRLGKRGLRIEPTKRHPWLLSTDMHIRQGQMEITALKWDADRLTLSGMATRPKDETGTLYLIAAEGFKPADYHGLGVAQAAEDGSLIIRRRIDFSKSTMPWQVGFERIAVPPTT